MFSEDFKTYARKHRDPVAPGTEDISGLSGLLSAVPEKFNFDKTWESAWFRQTRSLQDFSLKSGEEEVETFVPRSIKKPKRCGEFLLQLNRRSDRLFPFPDTSNYP